MTYNQPEPEEDEQPKKLWSRLRDHLFGVDDDVEEEEAVVAESPHRENLLRMSSSRSIRTNLWKHPQVFGDAKAAADALKSGSIQILNLDSVSPQMAEKMVDFLSGVTYAMDGSVEHIGQMIYFFAPANVIVELDEDASSLGYHRDQ